MRGQEEITNSQDIIRGSDVEERMDALQGERDSIADSLAEAVAALKEETDKLHEVGHEPDLGELQEAVTKWEEALTEWDESSEGQELKALRDLWENITSDSTLIRESYFEKHAQEEAETFHDSNTFDRWPYNCINWEEAANALKMDYSVVDFDGTTYYTRD